MCRIRNMHRRDAEAQSRPLGQNTVNLWVRSVVRKFATPTHFPGSLRLCAPAVKPAFIARSSELRDRARGQITTLSRNCPGEFTCRWRVVELPRIRISRTEEFKTR